MVPDVIEAVMEIVENIVYHQAAIQLFAFAIVAGMDVCPRRHVAIVVRVPVKMIVLALA